MRGYEAHSPPFGVQKWGEVYRDYKLHIDFNIDFGQFSLGMDLVNIAA